MNVAVIGTNGMLSEALVKYYYEQEGVIVDTLGIEPPRCYQCNNFYKVNLLSDSLDYDYLLSNDVIIYAAAAGSLDNPNPNLSLLYSLNVNIPIEISIQLKIRGYKGILITFGSYMEIGANQEEGKAFTESEVICTKLPATNDYTLSKRLLSRYMKDFSAEYVNYHFILPNMFSANDYKPGQRIIPYTLQYLQDYKAGKNPTVPSFSAGLQTRQFITIEEMISVLDKAIRSRISSGVYNMGGGEFLSIRNLIERLFAIYRVPCEDAFFGQEVRRDGDIKSLRINGSKLLKELGQLPKAKIEEIFEL